MPPHYLTGFADFIGVGKGNDTVYAFGGNDFIYDFEGGTDRLLIDTFQEAWIEFILPRAGGPICPIFQ